MLGNYWKSLTMLAGALLALVLPLVTGDHSGGDYVNVAILAVGVVLTWVGTNLSAGVAKYTKEIGAVLVAGLVALQSTIGGGVTNDEWKQIAVAVGAALVVILKGNTDYVPGDLRDDPTVAVR